MSVYIDRDQLENFAMNCVGLYFFSFLIAMTVSPIEKGRSL